LLAIGGRIAAALNRAGEHAAAWRWTGRRRRIGTGEMAAYLAQGALARYASTIPDAREAEQKQTLKRLTFMLDDHGAAKRPSIPWRRSPRGVTLTAISSPSRPMSSIP
jgi:hypothetical protein